MKLVLAIARKQGANFGSNCAEAGLEMNVPDSVLVDQALLSKHAESGFAELTRIVDAQLARMAPPETPSRQEREECERSEYVPRRQRDQQTEPPPPARSAPEPPPERREYPTAHTNNGRPWRGSGGVKTPRELLGWSRKHGIDLIGITKAWSLPNRVLDWSDQDAIDAYEALKEQAPVNGHSNGYTNGRSY